MTRQTWFIHGEDGTIRPVTSAGRAAFALAVAWIVLSATVGLVLFLRAPGPGALMASFTLAAAGLAVFAYFAITRTSK